VKPGTGFGIFVGCVLSVVIACSTTSGAGKVVYDCSSAVAKQAAADLAKIVTLALAQPNYDVLMANLERELGVDGVSELTCIVEGLFASTLTPTVGDHAKLYLASRKGALGRYH
jgi:hypothetical protein